MSEESFSDYIFQTIPADDENKVEKLFSSTNRLETQ